MIFATQYIRDNISNQDSHIRCYTRYIVDWENFKNPRHLMSQDIHFSEKLACSSLWDSQVHETNTGWNLEIENAPTQE